MVKGDTITCLSCGTSWKEISAATKSIKQIGDDSKHSDTTLEELRRRARNEDSDHLMDDGLFKSQFSSSATQSSNNGMMSGSMIAIAMLFFGLIGSSYWLATTPMSVHADTEVLFVTNLQLKEQIGRDGKKVITVKGSVENTTQQSKRLPPIAIILRRKDGGEIVRWRYNSPKPVINPGVKTRFVSSIQYDTPTIAYAEAIIE